MNISFAEINLSRMSLDDCFVENLDEPELPLKLDSSVWSSPVDHRKREDPYNALSKDTSKAPKAQVLNNASPSPLKMFTVEDIERSIRKASRSSEALGAPLHYAPEPPPPINCRPLMPPPGLLPSPMSQSHQGPPPPLFNPLQSMSKQPPPPFRPPSDFPPLMHLMTSMGAPPMQRPMPPPVTMPQMPFNNLAVSTNSFIYFSFFVRRYSLQCKRDTERSSQGEPLFSFR